MTAFIDANRDDVVAGRPLGVEPICRTLQIAPSSYYAVRSRPPSTRAVKDARVRPALRTLWEDNYRVYGVRKLWKAARRAGLEVGRDQVARLMRAEGIEGARRGKSVIENDQVRASRLVMVAMVAIRTIASWCSGLAS